MACPCVSIVSTGHHHARRFKQSGVRFGDLVQSPNFFIGNQDRHAHRHHRHAHVLACVPEHPSYSCSSRASITASNMETCKPTLLDLPAAALACIALHLDRPQDRASLGGCCRDLQSHSRGWWASLRVEVPTRERAALLAAWLAQARPAVGRLQLEFGNDGDALKAFAQPSPPREHHPLSMSPL